MYKTLCAQYRLQFFQNTFELYKKDENDERRTPIDFGLWGQLSRSNFCSWLEEKPYWFWTLGVKFQGQSWHFVYQTLWARYRLHCFAQSLLNFICKLSMTRGGTRLIFDYGVKGQGQLLHLCIRPCGHDTDYSFCPITFKLSQNLHGAYLNQFYVCVIIFMPSSLWLAVSPRSS